MATKNQNCLGLKWSASQIGIKSECQVDIDRSGNPLTAYTFDDTHKVRGAQSIGYDANIDPETIFEICAGALYDIEDALPTVDITINKALDGYCPVYLHMTQDATTPTLLGRANCRSNIAISYFDCDVDAASGIPKSTVLLQDVQHTSLGYTFGVDGVFTEDVSATGNNIVWSTRDANPIYSGCTFTDAFQAVVDSLNFSGCCQNNNPTPNPKVQFKEDFIFDYSGFDEGAAATDANGYICDPDITVLPVMVAGIQTNGINPSGQVCIQNLSFSLDLNREDIFCLGQRSPAARTPTLPIQVDTTIDVISPAGGLNSFLDDGVIVDERYLAGSGIDGCVCTAQGTNRKNASLRVATCGGTRINLGTGNFLTGVSTTGASTDGDNLAVSYTFRTFNVFTVMHKNDCSPNNSGAGGWWANRVNFLCGN